MRTLRLSLVGTVILVLLGGTGGVVLAQASDEDGLDPMRASRFSGTWGENYRDDPEPDWEWVSTYIEGLGLEAVHTFDASDSRISGTWTHVINAHSFPIDIDAGIWAPVWSSAVRIDNENGAWSGTFGGYGGEKGMHEFYRLDGEGAYEGLTAVFGWVEEDDVYEGVIIPGVPPDYPEPVEPGAVTEASDGTTIEAGMHGPVVFGEDPHWQRLWVRTLEPRDEPRPAMVLLHGGGLVFGEPLGEDFVAENLADYGFVTFLPGYRLFDPATGANPWPAQVEDAQHAVRWVRAHADEYNVDPDRVCAIGYSAGGYLAGLLGTLDPVEDSDPDLAGYSSRPDCVVMGAGDGDLTVPYPEEYILPDVLLVDVMDGLLGGSIDEAPDAWEAASPAHNVDAGTPPFLVIHGTDDELTPVEMSRSFVDAMEQAGRDVEYLELPGGHMDVPANPELWLAIERFLVERMNPAE